MVKLRDERMRTYYGARYDHRANLLDWDYTFELNPVAPAVRKAHFRRWRLHGLAFELRGCAYNAPNRSLASMVAGRMNGSSVLKRGYWGDVANSPFAAVGVECDDPRLLKLVNKEPVKTACDIAYYNVLCRLA